MAELSEPAEKQTTPVEKKEQKVIEGEYVLKAEVKDIRHTEEHKNVLRGSIDDVVEMANRVRSCPLTGVPFRITWKRKED